MQTKIKLLIFILCAILMLSPTAKLHGHTYRVPLIIDTDMSLDDARALVLLFNSDMADVRLMVTSDGAVSPETGCRNLITFLGLYFASGPAARAAAEGPSGHLDPTCVGVRRRCFAPSRRSTPSRHTRLEEHLIAAGRELHKEDPPWREWSEEIFSFAGPAAAAENENTVPAARAIVELLQANEAPCIYLCLGPMSNLADALAIDDSIKENISRVIFYGTPPDAVKADWNTARDLSSARNVFKSGLKIMTLSSPEIENLKFDTVFFEQIKALNTPASRFMVKLHGSPAIAKLLSESHFRIWDEIAVIYLNRPGLFRFSGQEANIFEVNRYDGAEVYTEYIKLLRHAADSHLLEREVVVLDVFPQNPDLFKADVGPYVEKIIEKHGLEEWKACVLTNELHRHLGIYSLIGAKMGIRAREILEAPLDRLNVVSLAGHQPPLSCMNDGLQVSTGASLGRGTIKIARRDNGSPLSGKKGIKFSPAAEFIYGDQHITLKLKNEIVQRIKKDIRDTIKQYGNLSPEYFAHIRKLSLKYWYELDRAEIFDREKK